MSLVPTELEVYRSAEHPCSYLPGKTARSHFFHAPEGCGGFYEELLSKRWRRSGGIIYQPNCPDCELCQPIRLPVAEFQSSPSQNRTLKRNQDLVISLSPRLDHPEALELYCRYQIEWHQAQPAPRIQDAADFLGTSALESVLMLYRLDGKLIGAGWIDLLAEGISSVYFAFDPDHAKRRLGVFSLLQEIVLTRKLGKKWLYLGFWIPGCPAMEYKSGYRPHEILQDGRWQPSVSPPGPGSGVAAGPG